MLQRQAEKQIPKRTANVNVEFINAGGVLAFDVRSYSPCHFERSQAGFNEKIE